MTWELELPAHATIAVVDENPAIRTQLRQWLGDAGYRVVEFGSHELLGASIEHLYAVLVERRGGESELLARVQGLDPALAVVLTTDGEPHETGASETGAYEVLKKPLSAEGVLAAVHRSVERRVLFQTVRRLRAELARRDPQAFAFAGSGASSVDGLPATGIAVTSLEGPVRSLRELEREAIQRALTATGGSVGKAARLLGMGRATLYRRLAAVGPRGEGAPVEEAPFVTKKFDGEPNRDASIPE